MFSTEERNKLAKCFRFTGCNLWHIYSMICKSWFFSIMFVRFIWMKKIVLAQHQCSLVVAKDASSCKGRLGTSVTLENLSVPVEPKFFCCFFFVAISGLEQPISHCSSTASCRCAALWILPWMFDINLRIKKSYLFPFLVHTP